MAARKASASQTLSHAVEFGWRAASVAAAERRGRVIPAGDGGEGGGALHGVADEAEVGGGVGRRSGAALARAAVRRRRCWRGLGHCEDRVTEGVFLSSTL